MPVRALGAAAAQMVSTYSFAKGTAAIDELTSLTLTDAAAKIRSGEVTSLQLTQACLDRIAIYDPKLDAFITIMKDMALGQAKQLDAEQKAG